MAADETPRAGSGEAPAPDRTGIPVWAAAAAYWLLRWLLAEARLPPQTPLPLLAAAAVASVAAGLGAPIVLLAALARPVRPARRYLLLAAAGLLCWLAVALGAPGIPERLRPAALAAQDLGMIFAAGGIGAALGSAVREPNILVPAGIFAAFADIVVVNFGTVRHALSTPKGQALVQAVSPKVPSLHPTLPVLTVGPADFLFLGLLLVCTAKFEMGVARTALVLAVVLGASLLLVGTGLLGPLPALAPMAAAFLAVNARRFRLSRDELIGSAVVLAVTGALFLGYFLFVFRAPGK